MTNHQASQGHPFLSRPNKHTSLVIWFMQEGERRRKERCHVPSGKAKKGWLSAGAKSVRPVRQATDFIFTHVLDMTTAQETH